MKHLAAVALMVVGISIPVCAQHGGSHGGFSGHSASASHGSFRASSPSRFAAAPRSSDSRAFAMPQFRQRGVVARAGARAPYTGSWRYRRPYVRSFGIGAPYGVGGWVVPGYLGYPSYGDDPDQDNSAAAQGDAYDGPPQPAQFAYPYQPPANMPQAAAAPASQEAVTLVFADGRPSEQIHNYMLTRSTLFVLDQHHRDIPLDELDLAATAKVNHDAGIDFHLPEAPGQ
ncbi:MAG: hypothetical protein ABR923_12195 [Terracidiphilus sp.]